MFLNWVWLCISEDIWQCPKTFPVVTACKGDGWGVLSMLLASSGWNPEMLFYILQYARQSPIRKNYPVQNVSSAKVKKPSLKGLMWSEPFYLWAYPIPFPHSLHTEEWCPSHSLHMMTHSTQSLFSLLGMCFLRYPWGSLLHRLQASANLLILSCNSPHSSLVFSILFFYIALITMWHSCYFTCFLFFLPPGM